MSHFIPLRAVVLTRNQHPLLIQRPLLFLLACDLNSQRNKTDAKESQKEDFRCRVRASSAVGENAGKAFPFPTGQGIQDALHILLAMDLTNLSLI